MLIAGILPLLPWIAFSMIEFGNPLPDTLATKRALGESSWWNHMPYWRGSRQSLALLDQRKLELGYRLFANLSLLLGAAIALRRHIVLPLILFEVARTLAYVALGVPCFQWYATSLQFVIALVVAAACGEIWSLTPKVRPIAVVALFAWLGITAPSPRPLPAAYVDYRAAAEWIVDDSDIDVSVGCLEVGCVGYFVWLTASSTTAGS